MELNELVDLLYDNVAPEQTAEFFGMVQDKIMSNAPLEDQKIIADQLESVGVTIAGLPCKAHPG